MHRTCFRAITAAAALFVAGCGGGPTLPPAPPASSLPSAEYRIGPGDNLNIFVWRNPELSITVPVRPDGRLSIPLVEDVVAIGKTPTVLDAMIAVGGLTRFAAGNDTVLIRTAQGEQNTYSVHLNSLIRDGDIESNVALRPGDILIIPQRLF